VSESFWELVAAERDLERQAWARQVAATLDEEELEGQDPFELAEAVADYLADQQPTSAALTQAILERVIARQAARATPERARRWREGGAGER
jgi:type IV secretory pathway VirD2 relaxase